MGLAAYPQISVVYSNRRKKKPLVAEKGITRKTCHEAE